MKFITEQMAVKNLRRRPVRTWCMIFFVFMLSAALFLSSVLVESMQGSLQKTVVSLLREKGLKIGSTTGYTSQMMEQVLPRAAELGYEADCVVTPDVTGASRPTPFMLFECMRRLNVYPPEAVVKVGDTVVDIQEGKNAGAWSVGILTGSNLLGLTQAEYNSMAPDELEARKQRAAERYREAGADLVIDSIWDLPAAVEELNRRMAREEAER